MSFPMISNVPCVLLCYRVIILNVDDFPAPLGPSNPTISYSLISNFIPLTASTLPPYTFTRSFVDMLHGFSLSFCSTTVVESCLTWYLEFSYVLTLYSLIRSIAKTIRSHKRPERASIMIDWKVVLKLFWQLSYRRRSSSCFFRLSTYSDVKLPTLVKLFGCSLVRCSCIAKNFGCLVFIKESKPM